MWMQQTGEQISDGEQYCNCPCNNHNKGILQKSQKSSVTKFYEIKCKEAFIGDLPLGWLPQSVIIEGMFIINAIPIKIHNK